MPGNRPSPSSAWVTPVEPVRSPAAASDLAALPSFRFMLSNDRDSYIIFGAAEDIKYDGPEAIADLDGVFRATPRNLPADVRAMSGTKMRTENGCVGTVAEFWLLSWIQGDWRGSLDTDNPADDAKAAFAIGAPLIAARIDLAEACRGDSFASEGAQLHERGVRACQVEPRLRTLGFPPCPRVGRVNRLGGCPAQL